MNIQSNKYPVKLTEEKMKKLNLAILGLLTLFIISCSEYVTESIEPVEKISPYEVSINMAELKQRRDDIMKKLPSGSIIIVTTNDVYLRNGDVNYEFRPASLFYYLTGFEEANAVAVIRVKNSKKYSTEMIMFVEERSDINSEWLGEGYGTEGAVKYFNADSAYGIKQLKAKLGFYLNSGIYNNIFADRESNESTNNILYAANTSNLPIYDLNGPANEMRIIKSANEIEIMQKSVNVSVQAFKMAIKKIEPGIYEYETAAAMEYILQLNGCKRKAFETIVASGANISTIHYSANTSQMLSGDLVMIDYGAEYGYYASDLTRTLPVNGKFSYEQKVIYEIVLEAYNNLISLTKPGISFYELSDRNTELIIDRLVKMNVIYGDKTTIISTGLYRNFIPASFGHSVGLDVHDPFPGSNNSNRILKENMVFAYEPHIYLSFGDENVNPKYRNVCARIEDIILVTSDGCRALSGSLPIEPEKIEQLMSQK
jgi:Xaa-Pro aminopeptidase